MKSKRKNPKKNTKNPKTHTKNPKKWTKNPKKKTKHVKFQESVESVVEKYDIDHVLLHHPLHL
jgi:hypothetical protein